MGSLAAPDGMIMTTREYITRYRNDPKDADLRSRDVML